MWNPKSFDLTDAHCNFFSISLTNNNILIFEQKPGNFEKKVALLHCWAITQIEILALVEYSWAKVNDLQGGFPIKFQVLG